MKSTLLAGAAFIAVVAIQVALATSTVQTSVTVTEGETMTFNIAPNYALGKPYRWQYKTVDQSATAGFNKDYFAASGSVVFDDGDGVLQRDIDVTTRRDCWNEPDVEIFYLKLYDFKVKENNNWITPNYHISPNYPAKFTRVGRIKNEPREDIPAAWVSALIASGACSP